MKLSRISVFTFIALTVCSVSLPCCASAQEAIGERLSQQLKQVEKLADSSRCHKAVYLALSDKKVRELFINTYKNECTVLTDICCLDLPRAPEMEYVHFNFDCAPNCLCLVDPGFRVNVDVENNTVVLDEFPYLGPTKPCRSILRRNVVVAAARKNTIAICANFGLFPDNHTFPGSFTYSNFGFESLAPGKLIVNETGGEKGLQFHDDGIRISLTAPSNSVRMRLGTFASNVKVNLFDQNGNQLYGEKIKATNTWEDYEFTPKHGMVSSLTLSGGGHEGAIAEICIDVEVHATSD